MTQKKLSLGIDTSNYKTSVAVVDEEGTGERITARQDKFARAELRDVGRSRDVAGKRHGLARGDVDRTRAVKQDVVYREILGDLLYKVTEKVGSA